MAYLDLETVTVRRESVDAAIAHLRRMGQDGFEGVALWAGTRHDRTFQVTRTLIPRQTAIKSKQGLSYHVDGDELHRINMYLYQERLTLIAQLHSHPKVAYHSDADDEHAIITRPGGLSIVVPDFARACFSHATAAVYRLQLEGHWTRLSNAAAQHLIHVAE